MECITILVIYNQLCSFILLGLESISAVPLKVVSTDSGDEMHREAEL